jgi:hypothetical protein
MKRPNPRTAFTIVELLVVIAIIGALVAMLVPAVQAARESARRNQCSNYMHQVAMAALQHDEAFGCLPAGLPNCNDPNKFDVAGGVSNGAWCQGPSWTVAIMPYMEEQSQFDLIKACMEGTYNVCDNCTQNIAPPTPFICPSSEPIYGSFALTALGLSNPAVPIPGIQKANFVGNFGSMTYFSYKSPATAGIFDIVDVRGAKGAPIVQMMNDPSMKGTWKMGSRLGVKTAQVQDGMSKTVMISELLGFNGTADVRGAWTFNGMGGNSFTTSRPPNTTLPPDLVNSCQPFPGGMPPYDFNCDVLPPATMPAGGAYAAARSAHSGGVTTCMADGSTHFINDQIDATLWQNLGTRNGGISAELPTE